MDTKLVFARVEAERHTLAMMDHPNIAKVLDAGTTETPVAAESPHSAVESRKQRHRHSPGLRIRHD